MNKNFKILSLFDGMSCAYIALTEEGHTIDRYVAYEIDKYAIETSTANVSMIEHCGDVFDADFTKFKNFDWVMFGFPCHKFSIAQKKDRETQPYAGVGWELFMQGWKAVQEVRPKYFLIENNYSMAQAVQNEISKIIGFPPIMIDAANFTAQNRKRIYWCGIRQPDGQYKKSNILPYEDKGMLLKDMLNNEGFKELSEHEIDYMVRDTKGKYSDRWTYLQKPGEKAKACCLTANIHKGVPYNIVAQPVCDMVDKNSKIYKVRNGHIVVKNNQYPIKLIDGDYIMRKLTVDECKRLQGIPDWYDMSVVSSTRALQQLGNGWCVPVIQHLIKSMLAEG